MPNDPNSELHQLGFSLRATFIPLSEAGVNDYPRGLCVNWRVEVFFRAAQHPKPVIDTTYCTGIAHLRGYAEHGHKLNVVAGDECLRQALEHGVSHGYASLRVVQPTLADVLSSLLRDADVLQYANFEDWASAYDYNPDSRKAERIYNACLKIGLALRAACGDDVLTRAYEITADL